MNELSFHHISMYYQIHIEFSVSVSLFREAGRRETERGRGDPVGDRSETEAADGVGAHQRLPQTLHQEHPLECGL